MQRFFFGNLILILILNLIVKPFYLFGVDAQVQNTVGAEDYGMYFSLLNFSFLFNILIDVGLTNYNTKNIAQHPQLVSHYSGKILGIKAVLSFAYIFVTIGLALLMGYGNLEMELLSVLVLNQIFVSLILFFRSNFAGLHWFKTDAILSVLDRIILIGITLVLLHHSFFASSFKIEWFVYAQTVAYGFTALTALLITTFKIGKVKTKIKRKFLLAIVKQSSPYALLVLLMMLYSRIDAVMLERILVNGKQEAGHYAQGFRLLDAANIFGLLVAGLLLPMFARMIKKSEKIDQLLIPGANLLVGVSIVIGVSLSYYSISIMNLIYNEGIIPSADAFQWIILSFIPMSATYAFGSLLTANGSLKSLNTMAVSGVVLNIILNFILISDFGAKGAAIATFSTQTFTALWQIIVVLKVFKLKISFKNIGGHLVLLGFLIGLNSSASNWFSNEIISTGFSILVGVLLLFILKIIDLKAILRLRGE